MIVKGADSVRAIQKLLLRARLTVFVLQRVAVEVLERIYRNLLLHLFDSFVRKVSFRLPFRAFTNISATLRHTPAPPTVRQLGLLILRKNQITKFIPINLSAVDEVRIMGQRLTNLILKREGLHLFR